MRKIIILCKLPPPYFGTTVWGDTISKSSLNKYFNIHIFNNNTHKKITSVGKKNPLNIFKNIFLYVRFTYQIIYFRPKLILIPFSQSTIGFIKDSIFILISYIFNQKVLLILHGSNFRNWHSRQNRILKSYSKKIIISSNGIIVLGNKLTHLFSDWIDENKIFVVPNGLTINKNPKYKVNDTIEITYLGNLQASKGIEDVVMAINHMKNKKSFIVNIIGSWRKDQTKEKCLKLIENNNLPIHFYDTLYGEKKLNILFNSDIFVFPPRMPEGHPLVIIEAMAAGLPIISTDQGAITESVIDGVNGYIVPINAPEQIADKLQYFINNPEVIKKMGGESRKLYEKHFTEEKMIDRMKTVINSLIENS